MEGIKSLYRKNQKLNYCKNIINDKTLRKISLAQVSAGGVFRYQIKRYKAKI